MEAETNLGRVSFLPRGEWDAGTEYQRLDIVRHGDVSYIVRDTVRGTEPPNNAHYMAINESLYAIARELGFTGTIEEFYSQLAALSAMELMERAEAAVAAANDAKTAAAGSASAAASASAASERSAEAAARSAADAAKVVTDVNAAGAAQTAAVNAAGAAQVEAIGTAGAAQVKSIEDAGAAQTAAVEDAGTAQVGEVNEAAAEKMEEISGAGAVLYTPQELHAERQQQARANIGAASAEKVDELGDSKADAITESASGEVLALTDAAEAPLRGLVVYGKSTQDGTPTPDAPVPIVSVGDDGEMSVGVYGRNLLDQDRLEAGTINSANGQASSSANRVRTYPVFLRAGTYVYSTVGEVQCGKVHTYSKPNYEGWIKALGSNQDENTNVIKIDMDCYVASVFLPKTTSSITLSLDNIMEYKPMLNAGSVALPYEPYTAQTLPIATPEGLRGVPVTSGGNYTDANGQQWICDEVDFARGVRMQRINRIILTGGEGYDRYTIVGDGVSIYSILPESYMRTPGICTHAIPNTGGTVSNSMWLGVNNKNIYWVDVLTLLGFNTVDDLKSWVAEQYNAGSPVQIYHALATPIETPLTESELAAYRALYTNHPNTTIYADDNAGLAVDYKADTKRYIDKKIAEIAAAVVANA